MPAKKKPAIYIAVDAFSQEKIDFSINELKEERDAVKDLLK
jgi:hypothetical protein